MTASIFALIFFNLLARKQNLDKFSIYSNNFFFYKGWSATNSTNQFLFSTINEPLTLLSPLVILVRSVSPVLTSNEPLELLFPVVILVRSVSPVLTSNEPLRVVVPSGDPRQICITCFN